jgi:NADH:ubiquinone oxidoreductase subunit E
VKVKIVVCSGKHCRKNGSKDVLCALERYCDEFGLSDAQIEKKDCLGFCGRGPALKIVKRKESILGRVSSSDCKPIVRAIKDRAKKRLRRYLVN